MAQHEQEEGTVERARGAIQGGAAFLLRPLRAGLLIALGASAILTRAIGDAVGRAVKEGERQLELFNGSVGRAAWSVWPRRRAAGKASSQPKQRATG